MNHEDSDEPLDTDKLVREILRQCEHIIRKELDAMQVDTDLLLHMQVSKTPDSTTITITLTHQADLAESDDDDPHAGT